MDIDRPELYNVGKTANIYHSVKNEVEFEYERGGERNRDKEFTIVATAFKKTSEWTCSLPSSLLLHQPPLGRAAQLFPSVVL